MSLNHYARKVRNPNLPLTVRRSALRSCILRFMWLGGERSEKSLARYESWLGLQPQGFQAGTTTELDLVRVLMAIERERNRTLEKLRVFERRRIRAKMRGRRRLSNVEQAYLQQVQQPLDATAPIDKAL